MKKINLSLILILFFNSLEAQNPLVKQWDYRFGGMLDERINCFQQTREGGYILGGLSNSNISGDKTQNTWGDSDYWITKIDSLGNKQWDKDFGGTNDDRPFSLQQTTDGGYILGGKSSSDSSGDKTQHLRDTCFLCIKSDYWIVKTDSLGNKQWDKDFGGTSEDYLYSLQQTTDGGYILGGCSYSGIGGDKTDSLRGGTGDIDYWIIKTDSLGNKQWDKSFGGTSEDYLHSVQQTTDGGYILGGYSRSGISGDKTQISWGFSDFWIVKIDSSGNKQWDKDIGGTSHDWLYFVGQTADGGYILGGLSASDSSGDKTQDTWGVGYDYWIIKIDSAGNKQWDKDFGGTGLEAEFGNVYQIADGGYLIAGTSYSPLSGNKTEANLGVEQTWIVKTDSLGNTQWDKTIFTPGHDENGFGIQTKDGCYAFATASNGGIGGYKTQPNWDTTNFSYDYWIVKFCDTTSTTGIQSAINHPHSAISISPNPFTDELTITFQKQSIKQVSFTVKNILGQTVFNQPETRNQKPETILDLSFLSKGIYLLEVTIDRERTVKKIVKE